MEERPPIWRVAANVLNKQSVQSTMGGPPAWGLGEVLTTPHRKKYHVAKQSMSAQDRERWRTLMTAVITFGFHKMRGCNYHLD